MRSHVACLAVLWLNTPASQSAVAQGSGNLYARSLVACVESKQSQSPLRSDVVIVVHNAVTRDPELFYPLPSHVGPVRLEFLDYNSLKRKYGQTGREFQAIEIKPMRNWRDVLMIDCADYRVTVRKRQLILGVIGGRQIHWRLDPRTGDYEKVKVERWFPSM